MGVRCWRTHDCRARCLRSCSNGRHAINRAMHGLDGSAHAMLLASRVAGCGHTGLTGRRIKRLVLTHGIHQHRNGLIAGRVFRIAAQHFIEGTLHKAGAAIGKFRRKQFVGIVLGDVLVQRHAQLTATGAQCHIQATQDHTDNGEDQQQYQQFTQTHIPALSLSLLSNCQFYNAKTLACESGLTWQPILLPRQCPQPRCGIRRVRAS